MFYFCIYIYLYVYMYVNGIYIYIDVSKWKVMFPRSSCNACGGAKQLEGVQVLNLTVGLRQVW